MILALAFLRFEPPQLFFLMVMPDDTTPPDDLIRGHYHVSRCADGSLWELGSGGMGRTYKAIDTKLGVPVALKIIHHSRRQDSSARSRFIQEAKAAASVVHPNVVTIHYLGDEDENCFYVMEFIDGETVEARAKRLGRFSVSDALRLTLQAARALAAVHRHRLVHRDIKPENLMLTDVSADVSRNTTLKIIDFGLVKRLDAEASEKITLPHQLAGYTPAYASPEQHQGLEVDSRSDFYNLGATLWFMLTNQAPFVGQDVKAMHLHALLPVEMLVEAGIPERVRELLTHLLEKSPDDRPRDADTLLTEIMACQRAIGGRADDGAEPSAPTGQTFIVPDNFPSIQAAIDNAYFGDTVQVRAGRYEETLRFKTGIRLIGEGMDCTAVHCPAAQSDVMIVSGCTNGEIAELTFEHTGQTGRGRERTGIQLDNSAVKLRHCRMRNAKNSGICSYNGDRSIVSDCEVIDSGSAGILVRGSDTTPTLNNNRVSGNKGAGIVFAATAGGWAEANVCENNARRHFDSRQRYRGDVIQKYGAQEQTCGDCVYQWLVRPRRSKSLRTERTRRHLRDGPRNNRNPAEQSLREHYARWDLCAN